MANSLRRQIRRELARLQVQGGEIEAAHGQPIHDVPVDELLTLFRKSGVGCRFHNNGGRVRHCPFQDSCDGVCMILKES